MRRTIGLIFVIGCLLSPVSISYAQNILINPFEQYNLLLEKDTLPRMHMPQAGIRLLDLKQVQIATDTDDIILKIRKIRSTIPSRELFKRLYNRPKVDEAGLIREEWKRIFGFDVWYPYYKSKEVEKWVKKKLSIKFFKLKGEPKFAKNHILYVFKAKF